jgi:hypothetical protein
VSIYTVPSQLLLDLHRLRGLLEEPTRLSPWRNKIVRREAQRLGDRCWYYAGWYAAQSNRQSENIGRETLAKLARLNNLVQAHVKLRTGPGRPRKGTPFLEGIFAVPEFAKRVASGEAKTSIVADLQSRKHSILDGTKKVDFYVKRFERALERQRSQQSESQAAYDPLEGMIDLEAPPTKSE